MNTYEISIPVFEGPMDLLMYLVNKNRIDINDIPIHFITEQYLDYLNQAGEFNLPLGSEFFENGGQPAVYKIQDSAATEAAGRRERRKILRRNWNVL